MKKHFIIILSVSIFFTINTIGQNLLLVDENSFLSSDSYILESNSNQNYIKDLEIVFAKDGNSPLIALKTTTLDVQIRGKIIIYLDNAAVISLVHNGLSDYVDKITSSVYLLSKNDLDKLKNSNINTIRFTLLDRYGNEGAFGGNFSAANKSNINFPSIITEFFR